MHYIYSDKSLKMFENDVCTFMVITVITRVYLYKFLTEKNIYISIISIIIILFKHNDIIYGLGLKLA